jgi:hypothetical protein
MAIFSLVQLKRMEYRKSKGVKSIPMVKTKYEKQYYKCRENLKSIYSPEIKIC